MSKAEKNFAYWVKRYDTDLANGRDPNEFGMRWMRHQIAMWQQEIDRQSDKSQRSKGVAKAGEA